MSDLYLFCFYIILYYVIHSVLTTEYIKNKLDFRWYRFIYNIIAIVTLIPVVIILIKTSKEANEIPSYIRIFGIIFLLLGLWVQKVSFDSFSKRVFWGLDIAKDEDLPLVIEGLYSTVRHPLYFGALLIIWGLVLISPTKYFFIFAIVSTIYIWVGSRLEENKLIVYHPEYKEYRTKVPGIIPYRNPLRFFRNIIGIIN